MFLTSFYAKVIRKIKNKMAKEIEQNKDFLQEGIEIKAANEFAEILSDVTGIEKLETVKGKKKKEKLTLLFADLQELTDAAVKDYGEYQSIEGFSQGDWSLTFHHFPKTNQ